MVRAERAIRQAEQSDTGALPLTLERLTFRFVEAGFVAAVGDFAGGWWFAETLYGPGLAWK